MNGQSLRRGGSFALLAFAIFALHDSLIKVLGSGYSVFQIILFANLFAFIPTTMLMMADRKDESFRPRRPWLVTLRTVLGLMGAAGAFTAFTLLPLAEAYALIFASPLIITLMAVPLLGERIGPSRLIAVLVGLIGVLIVLRPGISHFGLGHAGALVAAVFGSTATIIVRLIGPSERSVVLILFPMIGGILAMAGIMPFVYRPVELVDLAIMASAGFLVVGGQLSIIAAYRAAPAGFVAPIQYSQIIWAILLGYLWFDEVPDKWVVIGTAIIIASGLFIVFRERTGGRSRHKPVLGNTDVNAGTRLALQPNEIAAQ